MTDLVTRDGRKVNWQIYLIGIRVRGELYGWDWSDHSVDDYANLQWGEKIIVSDEIDSEGATKKVAVYKLPDHITIEFEDTDMWISIFPLNKEGKLKDVRIVTHMDDDFYVDESLFSNVVVIKHRSEPTDAHGAGTHH